MKGEFIDKNILIISPELWSDSFVSKHHYALELAKLGNKVFFLNPPKNAGATLYRPIKELATLSVLNYTSGISGLRFLPSFLAKLLMKWEIAKLQSICGVHFDIVWSFDNSRFFDLLAFGKCTFKICHIMDFNMDFQLEQHARTADVCFGVTNGIVEKLKKFNPKSHFINHGFAGGIDSKSKEGGKIRAVYTGNLLMKYLNWPLIKKLVNENPEVDFIFIGNNNHSKSSTFASYVTLLKSQNNCTFLGAVPSTELGQHYSEADILLLFYDHKKYPEQVANSHKILEYLGSGKVVVGNFTKEYEGKDLLLMADSDKEYLKNFSLVKNDIEKYNNEKEMEKKVSFAQANSYHKQIQRIESLIKI